MSKRKMADSLSDYYAYLDSMRDVCIDRLREYVAIQSISGDDSKRQEVMAMQSKCKEDLETIIGAKVTSFENPDNPHEPPYPPILLGELGNDSKKATLLVYGHLDVQPADGEWTYDPFTLKVIGDTYEDKILYGRGSTDDKGPVLAWINAIQAYQNKGMEIPVNIKFCFEAMEEAGGAGLETLMEQQPDFFSDVDYVCISDNYWLGQTTPCVTYGLRGISYFNVIINGAKGDLHSGVYGGTVREALIDMINLFSKLTDGAGKILIDGVNDSVAEVTSEELQSYKSIDFDPEEYREVIGTNELLYSGEDSKTQTLMHRWRFPSLSIHGFSGAVSGEVDATIIPKEVTGRFSIRLVPDQDPKVIEEQVKAYCYKVHAESGSKNDINVFATVGAEPWVSDVNDANYTAGKNAMERVFGMKPDLTREGGSIPVTLSLQNATGASVMLLPIGQADDGAHSQNEKISLRNYMEGAKVLGTYLDELGKVGKVGKRTKKK